MITRILCIAALAVSQIMSAADQTKPGAGNGQAALLASDSDLVRSAYDFLKRQVSRIQDQKIRSVTFDAIVNPKTCIASRAGLTGAKKADIIQTLIRDGLANPDADLSNGIFPPVIGETSACPTLPMPIDAAPGGAFGGHHSYPGGLMLHVEFNLTSIQSLADNYRRIYRMGANDLNQDVLIAAPLWHDWAKAMVFQWNADGAEFAETEFGGNGSTDAWGKPGNSRTGAHHIIGLAEMMKRDLPPELVITTASAHAAPVLGNESKVVNWLRAAAVLAQIDPVEHGFLYLDDEKRLRLPRLRKARTSLLPEYSIHALSDADYSVSIPAVGSVDTVLAAIAQRFRFDPSDKPAYNTQFRNKVLSYLSAEHLWTIYVNQGEDAVTAEIQKIKGKLK